MRGIKLGFKLKDIALAALQQLDMSNWCGQLINNIENISKNMSGNFPSSQEIHEFWVWK